MCDLCQLQFCLDRETRAGEGALETCDECRETGKQRSVRTA